MNPKRIIMNVNFIIIIFFVIRSRTIKGAKSYRSHKVINDSLTQGSLKVFHYLRYGTLEHKNFAKEEMLDNPFD